MQRWVLPYAPQISAHLGEVVFAFMRETMHRLMGVPEDIFNPTRSQNARSILHALFSHAGRRLDRSSQSEADDNWSTMTNSSTITDSEGSQQFRDKHKDPSTTEHSPLASNQHDEPSNLSAVHNHTPLTDEHFSFIHELVQTGEDADSTMILFRTEHPDTKYGKDTVRNAVDHLVAERKRQEDEAEWMMVKHDEQEVAEGSRKAHEATGRGGSGDKSGFA